MVEVERPEQSGRSTSTEEANKIMGCLDKVNGNSDVPYIRKIKSLWQPIVPIYGHSVYDIKANQYNGW